jgi:hypothetical protein
MTMKRKSGTVIALVKDRQGRLVMGGDRRSSWDMSFSQTMDIPKINNKGGVLLGATGGGDLCSLFVDIGGFQIPEKTVKCVSTYMYHTFKPAVHKFLLNQKNSHKGELALSPGAYVEVVIGIEGTAWSMLVHNPLSGDTDIFAAEISLGPIAVPYATGCGRDTTYGILHYELARKGYLTQQILRDAIEVTNKISPGCGGGVDILTEDDY